MQERAYGDQRSARGRDRKQVVATSVKVKALAETVLIASPEVGGDDRKFRADHGSEPELVIVLES